MSEGGNAVDQMNELVSSFQKLSDLGAEISDQWKIGITFASFPKSFNTLVTALEARNINEINWCLVHSKIIDEAQRQKESGEKESDEK